MGKKILLATGGTGGHIFPAKALAEELMSNGWDVCFAVDKRACKFLGSELNRIFVVNSSSLGVGVLTKLRAIFFILAGMVQAAILLIKLKPDIVVGFGGYPTFPTMFVAGKFGYNTIIHEQNSILGAANRVLIPGCAYVAASYQATDGIPVSSFHKMVYTGNPVRKDIISVVNTPYHAFADNGMFRILVIGGSQGAALFNEIVPNALGLLPEKIRSKIMVMQQVRKESRDEVVDSYKKCQIEAEIVEFFEDVAGRYAVANLVICRGGATTLAELVAVGRPAIIVPIASSIHNHQFLNANFLAKKKAAWILEEANFNAKTLSRMIKNLASSPNTLEEASQNIAQMRCDGTAEMVKLIHSVVRL